MSINRLFLISGRFIHIMNFHLGSVLHSTCHGNLASFMVFWSGKVMPVEIIVIIGSKGWYWKHEKQCNKNPFACHNIQTETQLSPENCFIIPSEKVGISQSIYLALSALLYGQLDCLSCTDLLGFHLNRFGAGDMCLCTYEWQLSQSSGLICHCSPRSRDVWHPWQDILSVSQEWQQDLLEVWRRTEVLWSCHSRSQTLHFLCLSPCQIQQYLLSQSIKDVAKITAYSSASSIHRTPVGCAGPTHPWEVCWDPSALGYVHRTHTS